MLFKRILLLSEQKINPVESILQQKKSVVLSQADRAKLHKAANAFEAMMLKELLKNTNSKMTRGMFGGGMAEEFFADHLTNERAKVMVEAGGFGIAEMVEKEILQSYKSRLKPVESNTDISKEINKRQAQSSYGNLD